MEKSFHKSIMSIFLLIFALFIENIMEPGLLAQVATDGSTGRQTSLTGPDYQINADLGQVHGHNLFHSFSQFNINTGESASFSGPDNISNVISRVTGDSGSTIKGLLQCTIPDANFYFFNPNGLMFGPNAVLDIKGSFYFGTADYIRFSD